MKKNKFCNLTLLVIIGLIILVGPRVKEFISLQQEVKEKEKEVIKEQRIINNYQKELKGIKNPTVKEGSATEYLVQIEKIITDLNLELRDFLPRSQEKKEKFKVRPISLSLAGEYQILIEFFSRLEELNWATEVKSISLLSLQDKLKAEVELLLYSLNESRGEG